MAAGEECFAIFEITQFKKQIGGLVILAGIVKVNGIPIVQRVAAGHRNK